MSYNFNNYRELKLKRLIFLILRIILILFIVIIILNLAVFSSYLVKNKGNIKRATINMAKEVVGRQDVLFCLLLGISDDTKAVLTDTIILIGYNPNTQKAFLLSIAASSLVLNTLPLKLLYTVLLGLLVLPPNKNLVLPPNLFLLIP